MKELNRKVFKTIFALLTLFIITFVLLYNMSVYRAEYNNIKRNLNMMEEKLFFNPEESLPSPSIFDDLLPNPRNREIDNMMIMDYEVYSVILNGNKIDKIILHSDYNPNFNIEKIAKSIIPKKKGLKIGCLYWNHYSYKYSTNDIIIINTETINRKLVFTLMKSILILISFEILIVLVSRLLTERITKPAREAFEKQKDFIADASHELKTPLAVIMASSDELKSDKKNAKYIDNIKYETERMNTLIKSLLDLSKLEKGISIENYKEENLSKIIERASLTFEAIAFEQSLKIETNIEDNILLKCSKEEMERLISILIDNAIKHSDKDSTIFVKANTDKNHIHIEVINTGDPINPGDEEKIFERFYRADKSRNRDANRYGLGLAIAKNIVINHQGTIQAFSKENLTTFKIILKK